MTVRQPQFSVYPWSMPNKASPWLIYLQAPNVPVRLVPANNHRSSFTIGANLEFDVFFSIGFPTLQNGAPIGVPVPPDIGNFTFLCVFTLLEDIWVWASNGTAAFNGQIAGNVLTVNSFGTLGGELLQGMTIAGPGVPANTSIVAYGTGTGGTGTYYLSTSSTVAAENMTATAFPMPIFAYEMTPSLQSGDMEPGYEAGGPFDQAVQNNA